MKRLSLFPAGLALSLAALALSLSSCDLTSGDRGTPTQQPSAPIIIQPPRSDTLAEGQSVTFTVAVRGSPAPTFQWSKDGMTLNGATGSSYTIASIQRSHGGTYTVLVSNSEGSVTSAGAVLTVTGAPVITYQPLSQTVTEGQAVTFSITAAGSALTYQWSKDGVAMTGVVGTSYTITAVQRSQAGTYTVLVSNSEGSVMSAGAVLTVAALAGPQITQQPVSQTVTAGQSSAFSVAATGTPAPSYQWRKDGVAISGATGSSYSIATVQTAHAGTYSVVVSNSQGSVTSLGAVLTARDSVAVTGFGLAIDSVVVATNDVTVALAGLINSSAAITSLSLAVTTSTGAAVPSTQIQVSVAAATAGATILNLATNGINNIVVKAGCPSGTYTVTLAVTAGSNTITKTTTLKVSGTSGTGMGTEKTGVVWNIVGPNKGAFDLVGDSLVSASKPAALKDLLDVTTVAAPTFTGVLTSGNGTLFVKTTVVTYATATVQQVTAAYSAGTAAASTPALLANHIVIAKLRGGNQYALIKVTAVTLTPSDNLDKIDFVYKLTP